ncbi:MAG TPA: prenyltransferase/squalene oxidase repeat-containing protein [Verrucomicrobiaceae bacterium]
MNDPSCSMISNRREVLKTLAGAGLGLASRNLCAAGAPTGWESSLFTYLESLARPDGGYAFADQEDSHLTSTHAVIGCYRVLARPIPNNSALAAFVRSHHPTQLKKLEQERRLYDFQQIQSLLWLGEDAAEFGARIRSWKTPLAYMKAYEKNGNPLFPSELSVILGRNLLGISLDDLSPQFTKYLDARRRPNGTFNSTPAAEGGDGHVMNTWWGWQAWKALGRPLEKCDDTAAWLRDCQLPNGGFTWRPNPEFGGVDDVAYAWAAVQTLRLLGSLPANRDACVAWLWSLANDDGGFADRPGWFSNPIATHRAIESLALLDAWKIPPSLDRRTTVRGRSLPTGLKVFSIQIEAHGQGSPADAVELARGLRLHWWGAKNSPPGWIARAQAIADQEKVPVRFFVANEEYGTWVSVPGLGTYSHTSDVIAPAGSDFGESLANKGIASWPEYREKRLAPLTKAAGRLVWQFGENEELVRLFLDDSVERGGFAAISTFHFGNPDFTNSEPFLQRWRGKIPYVTLQDAHGPEPWWFADVTTGCRTLFLAKESTWEGWLEALEKNWAVAVRRDAVSGHKLWMHGGSREVIDVVKAHERDWRWWDNPEIERPMASLVVLKPEDTFEAGHSENGPVLRVRCAWECTNHGLLKMPLAELIGLNLDGKPVALSLVAKKRSNGLLDDHYHHLALKELAAGVHTAQAVLRVLDTKAEELSRTVTFAI